MPRVKCPRCATIVEYVPPAKPACTSCGYGSPAAPATAGAPAASTGTGTPASGIVGKPRSFGVTLLLILVTFGIYSLVYTYKVFGELDRQHGREHKSLFFWLAFVPFLGFIFSILYFVKEFPNLNAYRTSRGMDKGLTAGKFYAWTILGAFILVGPYVALYKLHKSANQVWQRVYAEKGVPYPA